MKNLIPIESEYQLREIHKNYFTASRVASLYGVGFSSIRQEYHVLRGEMDSPELSGDILERGLDCEPIIERKLAKIFPDWIISEGGFFPHPEIERLGATPDRMAIREPGGPGVLEFKVVAEPIYNDKWERGETVPMVYELQHQTQMECAGVKWGAIVPLVVGAFTWRLGEIHLRDYHPAAVARIRADVLALLDRVDRGDPPPIETTQDAETVIELNRLAYDRDPPADYTSNNELPKLLADLKAARLAEKESKDRATIAKGRIFEIVGDDGRVKFQGGTLNATTKKDSVGKLITPEMVGTRLNGRVGSRQSLIKWDDPE